ncbi:glycosyltransferase family 4 protein [Vibrio mangrovi]|uniref:Glycosyltransferase family 4 protein n=1 Tax=Vibrio mangrovi TaxID=474394 RepID=A0A1Y6IUM6_9VIBR|nr:glycosyltransferase family 4 protein [Vibrio mangrovi]MDW6003094.1 glycosyltransferase family 4 protein [Vibrio mangrovi]SMS01336.1 Lipopolysaccharide core biosynthesis protein RfaG [Vibrio mangrovi]
MDIIVLGTGQNGGIDAVIKNLNINLNQQFRYRRFISHKGGNKLLDLWLACWGLWIVFWLSLLPGDRIFHLHMSYKGSFWRKRLYLKVAHFFGRKVLVHLHGSEFKKFYLASNDVVQQKIRDLIYTADAFIVLSDTWREYIESILESPQEANLIVLPNFAVVAPHPESEGQKNHVLFLGALIDRKGIFDLLTALQDLPEVVLHVGGGGDVARFQQAVTDCGVEKQVVFHGWVDSEKKAQLMAGTQLLVLPSYNEGLPVVILEAMASGLPVLSTPVGGIPEVIVPGQTGYLVEPGNVEQLTEIMRQALNDKSLSAMADNARKLYQKDYDVSVVMPRLEKLYVS